VKVKLGPYPDNSKRKRKIKVHIDDYDVWGLDHTLALIILPALKRLNAKKIGAPLVEDEDVPAELSRAVAAPREHDWETDDNWFKRWDWVMLELIWTFTQLVNDDRDAPFHVNGQYDHSGHQRYEQRIANGLRLFGKYYQHLWD
jgi:hypothetical protein